MAAKMAEPNTITLEPAWYRCKLDGSEFRALTGQTERCPTCKSTDIEIVVEVAPGLSVRKAGVE